MSLTSKSAWLAGGIVSMLLLGATAVSAAGFDQYGYNETARIFNGLADGIDRNLDGTYFGNTTYANDKIVMKWNGEWDRGNDEGWSNPPYAAWIDNEWNGKKGGSGSVWHYKIPWVGSCGAESAPLPMAFSSGPMGNRSCATPWPWNPSSSILTVGREPGFGGATRSPRRGGPPRLTSS